MKIFALILIFAMGFQTAKAEVVACTGRTNNGQLTVMDFDIEITGTLDDVTGHTFYNSIITYTLPDGSALKQGIDLNTKARVHLDKITYSGSIADNYLELTFGSDNQLKSAVLNQSQAGIDHLPIKCEVSGNLPIRPVCSSETDKNIDLINAIRNSQDIDKIETAISCGANVNKADRNGCTPLMIAIDPICGQSGSIPYQSPFSQVVSVADYLINNGAFASVADKQGETPLIKAAKNSIPDIYETFIAAEADFDAQDELGNTALMYAAYNGDATIVRQILQGNPDRRLKNKNGETAYDIAKHWERNSVLNLVRIPDMTVMIEGKSDGTCSPLQIELKQGQTVEFVLKAAEKMFKLDSKTLGLELMADQNGQAKQILILGNKGTYNFTCGFHGANQNSQGKIIIQ